MRRTLIFSVVLALFGCESNSSAPPDLAMAGPILSGPSRGSAVALSPDDSLAVVTNRDTGTVTIVALSYPEGAPPFVEQRAELDVSLEPGVSSEPWQAAIAPDGNTAFIVTRRDQRLIKIDDLKTTPKVGIAVAVGAEPTGLALTPSGAQVWVANWVDGTVTVVDARRMVVESTVDLNATLAESGLLGSVAARPSLAHPRSIAITNDGDSDDRDESAYVTEYFAQRIAPEQPGGANADLSKEGVVYKVRIADRARSLIHLAPLADLGFKDHNSVTAGCFPNQLQSITIEQGFAYVTSICASPRGPLGPFDSKKMCAADGDCEANGGKCVNGACAINVADVKTAIAPVVSVIDLATDSERTTGTASLNEKFQKLYDIKSTADDGTRRFPLLAGEIAFVPGTGNAYVAAAGADALFKLRYQEGAIAEVGSSANLFINLAPQGIMPPEAAGRAPIGVSVTQADHGGRVFAFVANDISRNLTVVDLATQAIAGGATPTVVVTAAQPEAGSEAAKILKGKRFFITGTGRWSLKAQAWNGCASCHTDGLTDNVTWYFARGPRQSTSLDGSFSKKDPNDQRIFNWTAIFDELADFELNTRGVSGGVGATVKAISTPPTNADRIDIAALGHSGLAGSALAASLKSDVPDNFSGFAGQLDDWAEISEYVKSIRPPRRPTNLDAQRVAAGRSLFTAGNCQGCHGGDKWTVSRLFYSPDKRVTDPAINTNARLFATAWTPPAGFPEALLPAPKTSTNRFMRFAGSDVAKAGAFDQIQCILRPVGTFGVAEPGVAENGQFPELRVDMTTAAQGNQTDGNGYNPPSLLGVQVGAPFLHAGQARTLEALLSSTFKTHYQSLNAIFLDSTDTARDEKAAQLVEFLLSIDADEPAVAVPSAGATGGDFCAAPQ